MKICSKCKIEKDETEFKTSKRVKPGLTAMCKDCINKQQKQWRENNPETYKECQEKWRRENPEKSKNSMATWRENNPEKYKECQKNYRDNNVEKRYEDNNNWRINHLELRKNDRKAWAKENPEKIRIFKRKDKLKKYGLSLEEFEHMAKQQDNKCLICGGPGRNDLLCVDHDHITGQVRGLLCSNCNTGLGMFKDSIEVLKKALEYLIITAKLPKL